MAARAVVAFVMVQLVPHTGPLPSDFFMDSGRMFMNRGLTMKPDSSSESPADCAAAGNRRPCTVTSDQRRRILQPVCDTVDRAWLDDAPLAQSPDPGRCGPESLKSRKSEPDARPVAALLQMSGRAFPRSPFGPLAIFWSVALPLTDSMRVSDQQKPNENDKTTGKPRLNRTLGRIFSWRLHSRRSSGKPSVPRSPD